MNLELVLRKMSDLLNIPLKEYRRTIMLIGERCTIFFDGDLLTFATNDSVFKIEIETITNVKIFEKTKHCKIELKNGTIKIIPLKNKKFKFFIELR